MQCSLTTEQEHKHKQWEGGEVCDVTHCPLFSFLALVDPTAAAAAAACRCTQYIVHRYSTKG